MDIIALILTIIFALSTLIGFLRGVRRGLYRQALRLATTFVSIILAYFITTALAESVIAAFGADSIASTLLMLKEQGYIIAEHVDLTSLANHFSAIKWLVALPVTTLILPIVFTLAFIILNIFIKIAYFIVSRFLSKTRDDVDKMFFGAVLGAVEGLIIAVVILLPITNAVGIFDGAFEEFRAQDKGYYSDTVAAYDDIFGPLVDAPAVKMSEFLTAPITNNISKVDMDGETVILRNELMTMISIQWEWESLSNNSALATNATDAEKFAIVRTWVDRITSSMYLAEVISDVLSDSSALIEEGIINLDDQSEIQTFYIRGLTKTFVNANKYNLKTIANVLLDAMFYMIEELNYNVLEEESINNDVVSLYDENGNNKIEHVIAILNDCEYTRPMVTVLSQMLLATVFDTYTEEIGGIGVTYNDVRDSFVQVVNVQRENYLTEEEYKAARQAALNQVFLDHGVDNADPEILEDICDYLDEEYPGLDSIDDGKFNDIIFSGISYYVEKHQNEALDGGVTE